MIAFEIYRLGKIGYIGICILFLFVLGGVFARPGCMSISACNYDPLADIDNGTCIQCIPGQLCDGNTACCVDANSNAICDYDEVCNYPTNHGCTEPTACNYDPSATTDVGSCVVCGSGNTCSSNTSCCADPDNNGVCGTQSSSSNNGASNTTQPIISGCMISTACNYNPNATTNNGSCVFPKCNDRCPGDTSPEPFMDACGVCDADVSNDNACQSTNISGEDPDPIPTPEPPVGEDPDPIPTPEPPVGEDPDPIPTPEPPVGEDPDPIPTPEPPVGEDPDPIPTPEPPAGEDLDPILTPEPPAGEDPDPTEIDLEAGDNEFPFPIVEGSVYIEFDSPVQRQAFQDLINKYRVDSIDQPFQNLDIDTYRIDFDPTIPYGEFVAELEKQFGSNIKFTEPIALIQINFPLAKAGEIMQQTLPDYLSQIGYDILLEECSYLFTTQQEKIRVAIIDNGYMEHDDFRDHVVYTYDTADKDKDVTISETAEACAHGNIDAGLAGAISTNDIGIISAGYNPDLVLIKATPDGRPCTDITAGIEGLAKAADHADIINVSWGVDFDSQVLENVVEKIIKRGVVIVAAAGNFNTEKYFYPAAYPGVIAVGAVDKNNNKAKFSNHGEWVDIAAPGVDMLSTSLNNGYAKVSGTSQASPLTAGWLAFLMSHGVGVDELFNYLEPLDREDMGAGIISPALFCTDMNTQCERVGGCEDHGVAPLIAETASSGDAVKRVYGFLFVFFMILLGGVVWMWNKRI